MENELGKLDFQITLNDINSSFYPSDIKKGFELYQANRVLDLEFYVVNSEKLFIESRVKGSRGSIYNQEIDIEIDDEGSILIDSVCSCPVEYNCKHSVAVCYELLNGMSSTLSGNEYYWLEQLLSLSSNTKPQIDLNDKTEYRINYRINSDNSKFKNISIYKAKRLKNGSYSKGAKISSNELEIMLATLFKYEYLTTEDIIILNLLFLLEIQIDTNHNILQGNIGAELLRRVVKTGRAYYQDNKEPLKYSDTKLTEDFQWVKDEKGKYILKSDNIDIEHLFMTEPPFVILPQENKIYEVDTNKPTKLIEHMLKSPSIDEEDLKEFVSKNLDLISKTTIPLPDNIVDIQYIDTTPIPKLIIIQSENRFCIECKISFLYDSIEVGAKFSPRSRIRDNNNIYSILRKKDIEQGYIDSLSEYDLYIIDEEKYIFKTAISSKEQDNIEAVRKFLEESIPKLKSSGWIIEKEEVEEYNFNYVADIEAQSSFSDSNGWFELSFNLDINGKKYPLVPIVSTLLHQYDSPKELPEYINLSIEKNQFVHIKSELLKPILKTLYQLFDNIAKDGKSLRVDRFNAHLVEPMENSIVEWKRGFELRELSQKLRSFTGIKQIKPSKNLKATLREYQLFGISWLTFLKEYGFGGVLADDMGLGKTLQSLAFLQYQKEQNATEYNTTLVVVPTSLLSNWRDEITKFTPNLTFTILYGTNREDTYENLSNYDIVITTYNIALNDYKILSKITFGAIILDEAQKIKNPKAKITQAIKNLKAKHKLALTGTPMENHLGELWSIFDFLMPGFLGTQTTFNKLYKNPIEKSNDINISNRLRAKIAPFMLRRTKDEVLKELPEKIEMIRKVPFGSKQAILYENVRLTMEKAVRDEIAKKGLARSHIMILDALLKLRQVCCDPQLLSINTIKKTEESAKKEMFFELVEELIDEGRKILVFSQFTSMLAILEDGLRQKGIKYSKLTGKTRKREEAIEKFKEKDCNIFLISLKAGGVGLNLVEADTVIHYDPWWNPAVENQATDRAYRIGQNRSVFVYKLIIEHSIEEKILQLQDKKSNLQNGIYSKNSTKDGKKQIDPKELLELLHQ